MNRHQLLSHLALLLAAYQSSTTRAQNGAACVWITAALDTLLMSIIAKSSMLRTRCPSGLHIGIVFPTLVKTILLSRIFQEFRRENRKSHVKFYNGATSEEASGMHPLNDKDTDFSRFLMKLITEASKIRILITAACTDLERAIKLTKNTANLDKMEVIYWAGGFADLENDAVFARPNMDPTAIDRESNARYSFLYKWQRDATSTIGILLSTKLKSKILVTSRESHPYGNMVNSNTFPELIG
uniref:AlNc14C83G5356 protein n=1 Tax=Albugo laibachii Nc14 TaxID=890382 RepID=F0WFH0_9STRA|nr:AlNc14C83G5356 [Albugo laibachii Nc14]|eukprot:CCA19952.1 AlNc14C83G5356 [Albugo laibachii Nc14]